MSGKLEAEVSFAYGEKEVLRSVEFTARKGELLAIIGPNGAGKSTLLKLGTYATRGNVEEALRRVGLWERRREQITALSGGEYQLALIARALAQGSDVILLDEPTSHLDINHALQIMELLKEMKGEKVVIAVLHDLNLALRYADRLILLDKGEKVWEGTPEGLKPETLEGVYGVRAKIATVDGHRVLLAEI